jgi:hypothetical protein
MNHDLIREIAIKAGMDMCGCGCNMPTRHSAMFAELIVRECAEIANNNYNKGFCPVGGFIQDHFELVSNPPG